MAVQKEIWQQIGEGFVQEYYRQFDTTDRTGLGNLYSPTACLTWEGSIFLGREAIAGKLASLPFKVIQHRITEQDCQPTPDSCIFIMVIGQLKVDQDPIMGFHQVFLLKHQDGAWSCTNDVFRLAIHNIPA
ncbi:nuclear transport factor 2-like [Centroberyx affinis]|uniref:nuclear transport factor 2-like n=1 Tax=Centroberyx affinis TaxID=166261 RepID=UPI003A5C1360